VSIRGIGESLESMLSTRWVNQDDARICKNGKVSLVESLFLFTWQSLFLKLRFQALVFVLKPFGRNDRAMETSFHETESAQHW